MKIQIVTQLVSRADGQKMGSVAFLFEGGTAGAHVILDEAGLDVLIKQACNLQTQLRRERTGIVLPHLATGGRFQQ